eukprot:2561150-Prymnesium_polylepis.1
MPPGAAATAGGIPDCAYAAVATDSMVGGATMAYVGAAGAVAAGAAAGERDSPSPTRRRPR